MTRSIFNVDILLFGAVVALLVVGIMFLYSSGAALDESPLSFEYIRQIIWAITGLTLLIVISRIDYMRTRDWALSGYLAILAILIFTFFFGRTVNGSRSWIGIGSLGIQPSEFAKITTIALLARYLDRIGSGIERPFGFAKACLIVAVPMMLILMQPDFGTALVFVPVFLAMIYIAGIRLRYVYYCLSAFVLIGLGVIIPVLHTQAGWGRGIIATVLTNTQLLVLCTALFAAVFILALIGYAVIRRNYLYWTAYHASLALIAFPASHAARLVLQEYQLMRLIAFLDPYVDPLGAGWNIIQSQTAVGSGGLFGKGYLQGVHSGYRYLPQQSTDFIFSVLAEEWGFVGGLVLFVLFLIILLRGLRIVQRAATPYGSYIATGLVTMLFFHFTVNVGMAIGFMPVIGIPLFFLSYGGSSLWTAMIAVGLLLGIHRQIQVPSY